MTRSQMKRKARDDIRGHIGSLFLISLIIGCLSFTTILPFFGMFFMAAFSLGSLRAYMSLSKGDSISAGYAFRGFSSFWRSGWLLWLTNFFISLWSMLLFVPGIIKTYSYAMAPYVLAEHPELTARQCLRHSKHMMRGHKFELFVLELSFIPWNLLVLITLGIMGIWVGPYMEATKVNFYHNIKPNELQTEDCVTPDFSDFPSDISEKEECPPEQPTIMYPESELPYNAYPNPPYPESEQPVDPYANPAYPPTVQPSAAYSESVYPASVATTTYVEADERRSPYTHDVYAEPNPVPYVENSRVIMPKIRKKPSSDGHTNSEFFNQANDL